MKSTFARRMSIVLVLAMVLAMLPLGAMAATPTTLYLKPGVWNTANAWYSAYFFVGETSTHATMADTDGDGVYEVTVPEGDWTNVIFLRNDPADQVADWNGVWNQTDDLVIPTDGSNMYSISGWNAGDGAWSEYVYVEPAFYVCGTMNSWTLSYADHKMVKGADGVYTLTLTLEAGSYQFKVNDGTWGQSWGKDGGQSNIEFALTETSVVTFSFDLATKVPTVTSSAMGEVETFDYYLVGDMNGWSVSSESGMAKNDDGTYSITLDLAADTYEYKANNGSWDVCFPAGTENATVTVATACAVTFTLDPVAGTLVATGDGLGETPVVPDEPVVVTSAAVKGTIPGLDWDATADTGAMTLVDGLYTITIPAVAASVEGAEAYAFKVVANGSWDTAYPESDWTFYLKSECDVTITFNPETYEVTLNAEGLTYDAPPYDEEGGDDPIDPPAASYYVTGTPELTGGAGWQANEFAMVAGENGTYTYTFTALAAGNYSLKVTDGTWANSWTAAEGSEYLGSDGNLTFTVTATCDVVVTFDGTSVSVAGNNVTAKAPEELVIDKVLIAGGVAGDGTADPGNMFNGLPWAVGADILVNKMYDDDDGIYSITFSQVLAGSYEFKFVVNDSWDLTYATGLEVTSGVEETAWFAALGNSTVVVTEDGSTVTFVLDLSGVVYTGDNAKMTVTVKAPASIDENVAPEQIVIGDNEFAVATGNRNPVTAPYTATYTGTLYFYPTAMTVINWMGELENVPSESIAMQFGRMYGIVVDGVTVWGNSIEVVEGQTYQIGIVDNMAGGCEVTLTVCSGHNFVGNTCSVCGYVCSNHNWDEGVCLICGETCAHENWDGGWCTNCWMSCEHSWTYTYTKGVSHTFTCSGICGAVVTVEDTESKKFAINSAAPVLSDDIVMQYSATVPTGFESAYMVFNFNDEDTYVYEYTVNATNGRYVFAFPGLNPQKMGDNICATLYAYVDGYEVSVQIASYSVVKYCDNQLKKTTISAELRTALSDLLIYGECNQIYEGYKTDVLVTSLLSANSTLTPSTFPAAGLDSSYNKQKLSGTSLADCTFSAVTMTLGAKVVVRLTVTCTDTSKYTFKATLNGVDYNFTGDDLVSTGTENKYYLNFDQIKANLMGDVITFTIWEGDTQISRTLEYSVYTYVQKNQGTADETMGNLLKALYNYGEAVKKV